MTKVVLDSNVWDMLAIDADARERIRIMCEQRTLSVVVPDTLLQELQTSPFRGVPDWFPFTVIHDCVFVLDHSRLGHARLGRGTIFGDHRGSSNKIKDAVLADAVHGDANLFVSEDRRARSRHSDIVGVASAMDYASFRQVVLGL